MGKSLGEFEFKVKQLRKNGQFLFATVDVSKEEAVKDMQTVFRLVDPALAPIIFAFDKEGYWENPAMNDPSALTMESIGAFLSDIENRQDKGTPSWIREKKKVALRFATGST